MSTIALGSILKVIAPAAQKAGGLAYKKLVRLQKIEDALSDAYEDDALKKCVSDYEIIKGTWRGEFTEKVDRFLRSMETSGLAESLFNGALVKNRSPALQSIFIELFQKETDGSIEEAEILYNQIVTSFEISCEHLSKDPIISRMIRMTYKDIMNAILSVESAIDQINTGIRKRPALDALNEIVPRILRSVIGDTKFIRVETSQGRKDVDISKIYIAPRLVVRHRDKINPIVKMLSEDGDIKEENSHRFNRDIAAIRYGYENLFRSVSIEEIISSNRIVVLGNPGGGKSTLLQSICHRLANESIKKISDGSPSNEIVIPIRIILRDFEHARISDPQLNLVDYIVKDLLNASYGNRNELSDCVESLLSYGNIYLAFDGLDEILKTANRRQFVDIVNRFVRQYPLCKVLVTSREVGYDNAPLPHDEFEELILGDFHDEDVLHYAERFIRFVGGKKAPDARDAASHFMSQTAQNANDLRRNPLMLGLMMWIFNIRDDVPSNRPEIYRECARLMFERWDGDRGILVDLPQTFDRLQVFSHLASQIFNQEDLSAGVSSKWIEQEIRKHLSEVLESPSHAQAASRSMVQFMVDRSWVMSEKGEGVFSFTHQTFLEYFFATFNDDSYDSISDLLTALLPHIRLEEWDVVSRLSLQIKSDRNRRRQDESMTLLSDAILVEKDNAAKKAIVGYSIRCLEFLIGSEAAVRKFLCAILDGMMVGYRAGIDDATEWLPTIFHGARERRIFIAEVVGNWINDTFSNGNDEERDFVISIIDGSVGKYRAFGDISHSCGSVSDDMVSAYRRTLLPTLAADSVESPKASRMLFEWTGTLPKAALQKFGPAFAHFASPPLEVEISGLTAMALAASNNHGNIFDDSTFKVDKSLASLSMFGGHWKKVGIEGLAPYPLMNERNEPPISIWQSVIKKLKVADDIKLGAIVCCYLELRQSLTYPARTEFRLLMAELKRSAAAMRKCGDNQASHIVERIIVNSELLFEEIVRERDLLDNIQAA